jgi:phage repressor protein C with HTH and peptisase S24 domain
MAKPEKMKDRLGAALQVRNAGNQSELGRFVGVTPQAVQKWLSGESEPRGKNLTLAAEFLQVSEQWLRYGSIGAIDTNADGPIPVPEPRRAPIVGIAVGGPDGYVNIDDYSSDPHAYAIRVRGDSMRPRIRSGEYIVAEPSHQAQPGSDVVVKLKDGRAVVKEWLWVRGDEICLGSVNDGFPPMTIPLAEVESIHKVAAILPWDTTVFSGNKAKNTNGRKSALQEDGEAFQDAHQNAEETLRLNALLQKRKAGD